jgi:hypothetical protein
MKKNFIIFAALMLTATFGAAEIAKAADVTVGGQLFTRYEVNEHGAGTGAKDFDDATDASDFVQQRTAIDVKANINDTTSAFIQLQSNRNWAAGDDNTAGSNDSSFSSNDSGNSVGIHEAYFTLKNFASLPLDAKIGRQEIILDGHRLFGDTLWTMGQTSHDAVRLNHKHGNTSIMAAYILASEAGLATTANVVNQTDVENYLFHSNTKGILGGQLSLIYNYLNDPCGNADGATCGNAILDNDIHTVGFRQAGQLYGIDYRGEYYYQWGDANQDGRNVGGANDSTNGTDIDRDAYMFGVRVGKAFNNVNMKPSLTVWYDYLSGTSDADLDGTDASYNSFNTLFDTGHKFYGLQDLFLGIGGGTSNTGTNGLGLQDLAIKAKISPMPGWTVKADYHWFSTAEGVQGSSEAGLAGDGSQSNALGNELDITLVNKYNDNTKIMIGFSNYTTTAAFRDLRTVVGDGSNWAYLQFDVRF